ncbi:MAG: phosphoadenylyl-sulfate reductase [Bacteroidetes bacterium]|nr:MAG: phosphoadenylyl-sulfate reductase [Bacteroidota bacterium]
MNELLLRINSINELNDSYEKLSPLQRIKQLYSDFEAEEVMVTSSFAATSALLLDLVKKANPEQVIHFIDTGYHFEETITYVNELSKLLDLNVENVKAEEWKHDFTSKDKTWQKDPDLCCSINKVEPLNNIKLTKKVWISGLMKWQSDHRSSLNIFEERSGVLKFYPLIDVSKEERDNYILELGLPFHPLLSKGYHSIGCKHCTVPGEDRSGRWNNNPKTECGLHL